MPGKASLQASQYYAHPRNLFWNFIEAILGVPHQATYAERCEGLKDHGVALWDTLKTCTRSSSLEADIDDSTMVPNDFAGFLSAHPNIRLICFNGAKSESVFSKRIAPALGKSLNDIGLQRLPSTSPANASIPLDVKLNQWRIIAKT
jgi:TDG/mug DNA glycosylase family protein